jgi:hypothetical protein
MEGVGRRAVAMGGADREQLTLEGETTMCECLIGVVPLYRTPICLNVAAKAR